jgi:hypothetical protein
MKTYKRALSKAQAAACENAKHPRCKCRCQGALHGKGHINYQAQEREILDQGKEITSEQITAIVESLVSNPAKPANPAKADNLSTPGPTVREVEEVYRTEAMQGRLPLEVA